MRPPVAIKVCKQYFNFSSSHFLIFKDGTREPLHGHNYRVQVTGHADIQNNDMVFDFLDIKPIVREVCDGLDHILLLPGKNPMLTIEPMGEVYQLQLNDQTPFQIPKQDVLILPIPNTSAERLAMYIAGEIKGKLMDKFNYNFQSLIVEVEETPGQSAIFTLENN